MNCQSLLDTNMAEITTDINRHLWYNKNWYKNVHKKKGISLSRWLCTNEKYPSFNFAVYPFDINVSERTTRLSHLSPREIVTLQSSR